MRRIHVLAALSFPLVAFIAVGCKSQTAIVVTVDTAGIAIPDTMDRIQIVVRSADGSGAEKTLVSGDLGAMSGPYSATIIQTDGAVKSIVVKVRALKGSNNVGDSGDVEITFKAGQIVHREITLNVITGCQDLDEDGFFVGLGCPPELPTDCNDNDKFVFPGAPERCNGKDDNCDDLYLVDEIDALDPSRSGCPPRQGVCEGMPITCANARWDCGLPPEYSETESCDDLLDNNCDGTINEGCPCRPEDVGQPCGTDLGECQPGQWECQGSDKVCVGAVGPTADICDGLDNNCDGATDEDYNVGSYCVAGDGMCQTDGHFECQTVPPYGEECIPDTLMPNPQPEHCNDRDTQDEDCDGLSNENDLDSCPLTNAWASRCKWYFTISSDGMERLVPCAPTIDIGLFADSGNPPPFAERIWVLTDESYPSDLNITSNIQFPHLMNSHLQVTANPQGGGPIINLTDTTYEATIRFNIGPSGEVASFYEVKSRVALCHVNNCNMYGAGYECVDTPPDPDPTGDELSCSTVITN